MSAPTVTVISLSSIVVFWISAGAVVFTFAGYGALMALLARGRRLKNPAPSPPPEVCVIIVAHNEEARIGARIENLLASDYPPGKLRILLVSDGSSDSTVARSQTFDSSRVTILTQSQRAGKAAGLNAALAQATGEIIVFADARQSFAPDAIARLTTHFSDSGIGAVSGSLEIAPATSATGSGVDAYWRYEKALRTSESLLDSCIGCTGAIYAIRRELFIPIPEDTLLDDVVIPMQVILRGGRVIHDPTARAFDPQSLEPDAERRRKQRTLAGNFQMLFRYPEWLLPSRNRLWWQLLGHKYLRLFAPLFLVLAFIANAGLLRHPFYAACFCGQLLFYLLAALGSVAGRKRWLALPTAFVFLNLMTLRGLVYYFTRKSASGWR